MPIDGRPAGCAIHGSAVAIDGRAVILLGASGTGKSTLAAGLVAVSCTRRPIVLVGDDRILLLGAPDGRLVVRPHPRTAGFIERRGLGLVFMRFTAEARVAAVVALDGATTRPPALRNFPVLFLTSIVDATCRPEQVLRWPGLCRAAA